MEQAKTRRFDGDETTLADVVGALDPIMALLSLVQLTGDRTLLHRYWDALDGKQESVVEAFRDIDAHEAREPVDPAIAAEIRGKLIAAVASGRAPVMPQIDLPTFRRMSRLLLGKNLPEMSVEVAYQHLADLLNWQRFVASLAGPEEPPASVLILGDLNATPWCPPLRRFLAASGLRPAASDQGLLGTSWPVPIPFLRIPLDHALLSPDLVCVSYRIGPDIGSDHFPFILEVRPRPRTR